MLRFPVGRLRLGMFLGHESSGSGDIIMVEDISWVEAHRFPEGRLRLGEHTLVVQSDAHAMLGFIAVWVAARRFLQGRLRLRAILTHDFS